MRTRFQRCGTGAASGIPALAALAVSIAIAAAPSARADEAFADQRLKAMSGYLAGQSALSFTYDAALEVVTTEEQKLQLTSSGAATVNRPDKIRARRQGGFVDVEMIFDGKTLTIVGHNANLYTQLEVPGTIDNLIDNLRLEHGLALPGADLLLSDVYGTLMPDVTDVKDIGSGIVGGVECDHFAFRTEEVDWQIWIAQGDEPYPCRYVITTKQVAHSPQYSLQITQWNTGDAVAADDFAFDNASNAEMIALEDLPVGDLPEHFQKGAE
jgi:hypothetical protein